MPSSYAAPSQPLSTFVGLLTVAVALTGCGPKQSVIPTGDSLYLEAQKYMASGDSAKAMEAINASIAQEPTPWALYLRARLFLDAGDDASAKKDCEEGLRVDPADTKLAWLKGELAKPPAARFQGAFKNPPADAR